MHKHRSMPFSRRSKSLAARIRKHWILYLLLFPIIAYYIVFRYTPIFNSFILAMRDFKMRLGIWNSPFCGFDNFIEMFNNPDIVRILVNTVQISLLRICYGFLPPVILAIFYHDIRTIRYKRVCQTLTYIPHFFSWVIVYGVIWALVSEGYGLINKLSNLLGGNTVNYLMSQSHFRSIIILSDIWKEIGWGTIIYVAALSSIDPQLYEAAVIDGAGPIRRIYHISLPGILPVISFVMCLRLGAILYAGGEQILVFYNTAVYAVADIVDTWIYRVGIGSFKISLGASVGLFQSVFGMIIIIIANRVLTRYAGYGIW